MNLGAYELFSPKTQIPYSYNYFCYSLGREDKSIGNKILGERTSYLQTIVPLSWEID